MRSAVILFWCLLAVILAGFNTALAGDIQIHQTTQATSRGPIAVTAFLALGVMFQ